MSLVAPASYQGGKQRLASSILDTMGLTKDQPDTIFYDLCCGSGSVTAAVLNRGWTPDRIVMVDSGPWGAFWGSIASGSFNLERFATLIDAFPPPINIQAHLATLAARPILDADVPYLYPLLQAGAFGGKAIFIEGGRWKVRDGGFAFRSFWLPTEASSRRSPVNPMMPMPRTLLARVGEWVLRGKGLRVLHGPISGVPWDCTRPGLVYLDPPYAGTTSYGEEVDPEAFARAAPFPIWVSETRPLSGRGIRLASGRRKGGISGERSTAHEEWLTLVS